MAREWSDVLYWKQAILEGKAIAVVWAIEDVYATAGQMDVEITEEQAKQVLWYLAKCHDAEMGINWEVIEQTIEMVLREGL